MKGLILKDIFNIWHNVKSLGFVFAVLLITFLPQGGTSSYIIFVCILCSTMIVTTFSFDEHSAWVKYAMIMPVSRKEYVAGKFLTLFIFCGLGMAAGVLLGLGGGWLFQHFITLPQITTVNLLIASFAGLTAGIVAGSTSILLLFRFGAARARILSLLAMSVPFAIAFGLFQILRLGGFTAGNPPLILLLWLAPAAALIWTYGMYRASYYVFSKKELLR